MTARRRRVNTSFSGHVKRTLSEHRDTSVRLPSFSLLPSRLLEGGGFFWTYRERTLFIPPSGIRSSRALLMSFTVS